MRSPGAPTTFSGVFADICRTSRVTAARISSPSGWPIHCQAKSFAKFTAAGKQLYTVAPASRAGPLSRIHNPPLFSRRRGPPECGTARSQPAPPRNRSKKASTVAQAPASSPGPKSRRWWPRHSVSLTTSATGSTLVRYAESRPCGLSALHPLAAHRDRTGLEIVYRASSESSTAEDGNILAARILRQNAARRKRVPARGGVCHTEPGEGRPAAMALGRVLFERELICSVTPASRASFQALRDDDSRP
jgi:hypothetical protein